MISDQAYLRWQKKLAASTGWRRFWTFWAIYGVVFYFAALGWIVFQKQGWKIGLFGICTGLFARYVVCEIIHKIYPKAHPYQRLGLAAPSSPLFSMQDGRKDAFPSEHATILSAFSLSIYWFFPALGIATFAAAFFLPIARIIVGYHDVADVLGGWFTGLISAWVVLYFIAPLLFTR